MIVFELIWQIADKGAKGVMTVNILMSIVVEGLPSKHLNAVDDSDQSTLFYAPEVWAEMCCIRRGGVESNFNLSLITLSSPSQLSW